MRLFRIGRSPAQTYEAAREALGDAPWRDAPRTTAAWFLVDEEPETTDPIDRAPARRSRLGWALAGAFIAGCLAPLAIMPLVRQMVPATPAPVAAPIAAAPPAPAPVVPPPAAPATIQPAAPLSRTSVATRHRRVKRTNAKARAKRSR
jgi:hypothetical protein